MRVLGPAILLCLAIAALQALIGMIAIAIVLLIVWGFLYRTRQTIALLALGLVLSALQTYPLALLALLCGLGVLQMMARGRSE